MNLLISESMVIHLQGEAWLAPLDTTHRHAYTCDVDNYCLTHGGNVSYFPSVELIEYIHCTGSIGTNSIFSECFSFDLFAIIHFIPSNLLLSVLSNIFKFRPKQFPKCLKNIICFFNKINCGLNISLLEWVAFNILVEVSIWVWINLWQLWETFFVNETNF